MQPALETRFIDKTITEENHRAATYQIYLKVRCLFKDKKISLGRANTVLGSMLGAGPNGWRVVGITEKAFEEYLNIKKEECGKKFYAAPKGIQRGHLTQRQTTIRELLEVQRVDSIESLFKYWQDRDRTVICLRTENRGILGNTAIPIDNPSGKYFRNQWIGFSSEFPRQSELWRVVEGRYKEKNFETCVSLAAI